MIFKKIVVDKVDKKSYNKDQPIALMFYEKDISCEIKWITIEDAKSLLEQLQKVLNK